MSKIVIVAEAGVNHLGNMHLAHEMILRAKDVGSDLWKTQLYDPEKLFPDRRIIAQGKNWFDEVMKTRLNKEQVFQLAEWCQESQIEFFASCFDLERLGWLEEVRVKKHKVASREIQDRPLIEAIIATGKPIIASLGWWDIESKGVPPLFCDADVYYLYCISKYPTPLEELHLARIDFEHDYQGFSDHTIGIEAPMIAMARGAKIIEKHFTLDKNLPGPDQICSIKPNELKRLVKFARKVEEIL